GNLVLYANANTNSVAAVTGPTGAVVANMQADGNFAMYNSSSTLVWNTGPAIGGVWLMLYDGPQLWRMQPTWTTSNTGYARIW
ncbi:MAG TPA: hypothetical protein VMR98_00785, partial [Candidatus Polarisedimenticolaceae bacterium]|nr:hypothetical protein [Candidatus Polarisedimenticolaceae bacterium]